MTPMYRFTLLLMLLFGIAGTAWAQHFFHSTLGFPFRDEIHSAVSLSDSTWLMVGNREKDAGDWDILCLKADHQGNIRWQRQFGGTDTDLGVQALKTFNRDIMLLGSTRSFGAGNYDTWLLRLSTDGDILWQQTIGTPVWDRGRAILQLPDSGFLLAATTFFEFGDERHLGGDLQLIRLTKTGTIQWSKVYEDMNDFYVEDMIWTSDAHVVMTGYTVNFGDNRIVLMKVDTLGHVQWLNRFGGSFQDRGQQVLETSEGYIMAGYSNSFLNNSRYGFLLATDDTGTFVWSYLYGGNNDDYITAFDRRDDAYYLTGRTRTFGPAGEDLWLLCTDTAGALRWTKAYGGASAERGSAVIAHDSLITVAGYTWSFESERSDGYWLQTDLQGATFCHETSAQPDVVLNTLPTVAHAFDTVYSMTADSLSVPPDSFYILPLTQEMLCAYDCAEDQVHPGFFYTVEGDTVCFTDTSAFASQWTWWTGSGDTLHGPRPCFGYSKSGKYEVCLVAANSCDWRKTCDSLHVTAQGVPLPKNAGWHIYPNPAGSHLVIIPRFELRGNIKLKLLDSQGNIRLSHTVMPDSFPYRLDIADYASAYYILWIDTGTWQVSYPLVKW